MYYSKDIKLKLAKDMVKQATKNGGSLHEYEYKGTAYTFHFIAKWIDEMTGKRVVYSTMCQNVNLDGLNWKQIENWIKFYMGE